MKKVVDKSQVAHLWANQHQEEARTPTGNLYFWKDTIFSYGSHFPIGKHVTNKDGERATLFTTRSYSNTTAKHLSIVRQAARHLNLIFCHNPNNSHNENIEQWIRAAEQEAANLVRAKKPEKYLNEIEYIKQQVQKYFDFFGLDIDQYPTLKKVINIGDKVEYLQYSEAKNLLLEQEAKAEAKRKAAKHKKDLKDWRSFKLSRLYIHDGNDYLRFNTDKLRIETSQGIEIPEKTAKTFYKAILRSLKHGGCNGNCDLKILNFDVKSIDKKQIVIGCHTITIKEIEGLVKLLQW